jgi:hypothetical protein
MLSNSTYSSKVRTTFLLLKCRVESNGLAFTSFGAVVSFGPPLGGTMLAQRGNKRIQALIINSQDIPARKFCFIFILLFRKPGPKIKFQTVKSKSSYDSGLPQLVEGYI